MSIKKFFSVMDVANENGAGGGSPELKPENVGQATPEVAGTQTATANISVLADSNIQSPAPKSEEQPIGWDKDPRKGDDRYFQSGNRRGELRPKFARELGGVDAGKAQATLPGLNVAELRASAKKKEEVATVKQETDSKTSEQARKRLDAKTGAKMAMRCLDLIVDFISKKQYGRDFTEAQKQDRLSYRATLEKDWEDYLVTLDIPMNPALVVAFGSIMYTADAFNTQAGKERMTTFSEKIGAKIGGWLFSRGK